MTRLPLAAAALAATTGPIFLIDNLTAESVHKDVILPGGEYLTYSPPAAGSGPLLEDNGSQLHELHGKTLYYRDWSQSNGLGNPAAGPAFDATRCDTCHLETALRANDVSTAPLVARTTTASRSFERGTQVNAYHLGAVKNPPAIHLHQGMRDVRFQDGSARILRMPVAWARSGEDSTPLGLRIAPPLFGWGLLENVDPGFLRQLDDPDDQNGDGISGRLVTTDDGETAVLGWKNAHSSVRGQVAAALANDMGVQSSGTCDAPCASEISEAELTALADYVRGLPVPRRRDVSSNHGQHVFGRSGCADCHVAALLTAETGESAVSGQLIWPYSDLMLHDMGPALADPGDADNASEWRTAPLWGIGYLESRFPQRGFLHDGRARTLHEAILWHGGEAAASRDHFIQLSFADRHALLEFVRSL